MRDEFRVLSEIPPLSQADRNKAIRRVKRIDACLLEAYRIVRENKYTTRLHTVLATALAQVGEARSILKGSGISYKRYRVKP